MCGGYPPESTVDGMTPYLDRMIYIDDSGHPQTGDVTYGWIAFEPNSWSDVLGRWLECRKLLWREFSIPVTDELHTTEYVNGRGQISKKPPEKYIHQGQTYWKDLGQDVARTCLETLSSTQGLYVGAVGTRGDPKKLAATKKDLYAHLLKRLEVDLHGRNGLGMVFIDGDGTDTSYRDVHRQLPRISRRIVEDPIAQDSKVSQLVQMADLVAWSANVHLNRHPKNAFAYNWYVDYLSQRDLAREPDRLDLGYS